MAEEAKDEAQDDPGGDQPRADRGVRHLLHPPGRRAERAAGVLRRSRGEYVTLLGLPEEEGGYAGDPILGVVKSIDLGFLQGPAELYVGLLAATILFLATNAGIIGVSRLVYSMGIYRQLPDRMRRLHPKFGTPWIGILIFGVAAMLILLPGEADVPGQPLRVRRDALVHDRAHRGRPIADHRPRPRAAVPRAGQLPRSAATTSRCSPSSAASPRSLAFVVVTVLHPARRDQPASCWLALGIGVYVLYRRHQGLDLTTTTKVAVPRPGRRARGGVRVGARRVRRRELQPLDGRDRRASWRPAGGAASTSS